MNSSEGGSELFKSKSLFKTQVNENKEQTEAEESINTHTPALEAVEPPEASDQTRENKFQAEPALKEAYMKSKMTAASFGEMVSLLMRSTHYKHYSLAELEWLLLPPLMHNQFLVVEARSKENGASVPVGLALWASVSEDTDKRLSENLDQPIKLRPDEWKSGDNHWIIDVIGDEKIIHALHDKLKNEIFVGKTCKLRSVDDQGKQIIKELGNVRSS